MPAVTQASVLKRHTGKGWNLFSLNKPNKLICMRLTLQISIKAFLDMISMGTAKIIFIELRLLKPPMGVKSKVF